LSGSKSKDERDATENVNIVIRGKVYNTIMPKSNAIAYKERQKLLEKFGPGLAVEFSDLNSQLGKSLDKIGVPVSVAKRVINNEEALYKEHIKPAFSIAISAICDTVIGKETGFDESVKEIEAGAEKLYSYFSGFLVDTKDALVHASSFSELAAIAYDNLKDNITALSESYKLRWLKRS